MILELKLTAEQQEAVDKFVRSGGMCFCGITIKPEDNKGLLAQPHSSEAAQTGKLKVAAVCTRCFGVINVTFKTLGHGK